MHTIQGIIPLGFGLRPHSQNALGAGSTQPTTIFRTLRRNASTYNNWRFQKRLKRIDWHRLDIPS
jgi:hypothetical protein